MPGEVTPYRALLAALGLVAVAAVAVGGAGLYTVLTGGTAGDAVGTDVLGEFACEGFDDGPAVAHEAGYGIERTVLGGSELESFEGTRTAEGYRFEVAVASELLDASAARADGTELTVTATGEGRLTVETDTADPFRLWIDTVTEDGTVVRTRLAVCPTR